MPERYQVLVCDDDDAFRDTLMEEVASFGHRVEGASRVHELLDRLAVTDPEVIILDLRMPGMDGIEGIQRVREAGCQAEIIMLTGVSSVEKAVESIKLGAFYYLTKPCRRKELRSLVSQAGAKRRLQEKNAGLIEMLKGVEVPFIVGDSPQMERVMATARRAAPSEVPVLIQGETGTGKELLARFLHNHSRVARGPFVVVNCATLPESTLQSELFGHEKGAFTGATKRRLGLFELADGGTLFLDEVGEIGLPVQVQLLRFLQFGELRRLGSNDLIQVKVRVLAATNRALAQEVDAGNFREDLLYRLDTIMVELPPLRRRRQDIPRFVAHFLKRHARPDRPGPRLTDDALKLLCERPWPGNVRQLENMITRLIILSISEEITRADVASYLRGGEHFGTGELGEGIPLKEIEKKHILLNMERTGGDKKLVATELGIALKTLYNRLHEYGEMPG